MDFDPQALIDNARQGALRSGEAHALSLYVSGLQREKTYHRDFQIAEAKREAVSVCLNPEGSALLITFPGSPPHTISLPLGRPSLAMEFLVSTLKKRRGEVNTIATSGAPTQADLTALARATTKRPRKRPNEVTLEDLGL